LCLGCLPTPLTTRRDDDESNNTTRRRRRVASNTTTPLATRRDEITERKVHFCDITVQRICGLFSSNEIQRTKLRNCHGPAVADIVRFVKMDECKHTCRDKRACKHPRCKRHLASSRSGGIGRECGHNCRDKRACKHPCCKRHLSQAASAAPAVSRPQTECGHNCRDKRACKHPCCKRHLPQQNAVKKPLAGRNQANVCVNNKPKLASALIVSVKKKSYNVKTANDGSGRWTFNNNRPVSAEVQRATNQKLGKTTGGPRVPTLSGESESESESETSSEPDSDIDSASGGSDSEEDDSHALPTGSSGFNKQGAIPDQEVVSGMFWVANVIWSSVDKGPRGGWIGMWEEKVGRKRPSTCQIAGCENGPSLVGGHLHVRVSRDRTHDSYNYILPTCRVHNQMKDLDCGGPTCPRHLKTRDTFMVRIREVSRLPRQRMNDPNCQRQKCFHPLVDPMSSLLTHDRIKMSDRTSLVIFVAEWCPACPKHWRRFCDLAQWDRKNNRYHVVVSTDSNVQDPILDLVDGFRMAFSVGRGQQLDFPLRNMRPRKQTDCLNMRSFFSV